jgi:hypothetical protein
MNGVIKLAIEAQRSLVYGRTVGLSDEDAREVVKVWRWEAGILAWDRVRAAMVLRSLGEEWRP